MIWLAPIGLICNAIGLACGVLLLAVHPDHRWPWAIVVLNIVGVILNAAALLGGR